MSRDVFVEVFTALTVSTWLNLVKQPPAYAKHIWLCGALLLFVLLATLRFAQNPAERAQAYGALVADSIAEMSAAPLLKQDRIELGLLCNRMAQLPAVTGVTIVGVDQQVLSVTAPNPPGITFKHPIRLEDAVIGEVQVTINPDPLVAVTRWPWLLSLVLLLLMPWLLAGLQWLLEQLQAQQQIHLQDGLHDGGAGAAAMVNSATNNRGSEYLLVASLLNQLNLRATEPKTLLTDTTQAAAQVASFYRGHLEMLPGKGLGICFADDPSDGRRDDPSADRAFEVVCAALLLARYLRSIEGDEQAKFQLGLHYHGSEVVAEEGEPTDHTAAQSETVLLAAAAGTGQVILSAAALAKFKRPERLVLEPFEHPLAADLDCAGGQCYRLTGLAEQYAQLLDQQLASLKAQTGSTDSESTF